MYQCHKSEAKSVFIIAIIIVVLCSLSAYFISDFASKTQIKLLAENQNINTYNILFKVNNITSLFVPIIICSYISMTTHILLTDFFDIRINMSDTFCVVGIAMTPILLDDYFLWFNLITYTSNINISSYKEFMDIEYFAGLKIQDFQAINTYCWIGVYLIIFASLVLHKISFFKAIISTILPSGVLILSYKCISFLVG